MCAAVQRSLRQGNIVRMQMMLSTNGAQQIECNAGQVTLHVDYCQPRRMVEFVSSRLFVVFSQFSGFTYTKDSAMKQFKSIFAIFCAALLMSVVVGCAATPTQQGTGGYVDDSVITTKVKAAIFNEPTLKSAEVNVETFKGVVQLSGFVSTQANIQKAVEVTRNVAGVTSVKNDMRLR